MTTQQFPEESNSGHRNHAFYSSELLEGTGHSKEVPAANRRIIAHYTMGTKGYPTGVENQHLLISDYSPSENSAFGFVCHAEPEFASWEHIDLGHVERLIIPIQETPVLWHRDQEWECVSFGDLRERQGFDWIVQEP